MLSKLEDIEAKYLDIEQEMSSPEVASDNARLSALHKKYKQLDEIVSLYRAYKETKRALEESKVLLEQSKEEDFRALAKEEIDTLSKRQASLEQDLKKSLVPKDPQDAKHAILELRAGTGGDEASLFVGDLFRMYARYVEQQGWSCRVIDATEGPAGGYKELVAHIVGSGAYGRLKYESGVHRVQRVPVTETQGRVHTSAASVVVLPEMDEVEVKLDMREVRKDTFCSSGPGGQSVNTTYSAIRLTHLPTGLVVSCQDEKSQIKNLEKALKVLRARLYTLEQEKHQKALGAQRKSMVKTGDRSDKIRTYNYPQGRVTDHRISHTVHNLPAIMDGQLESFVEKLHMAKQAEKLQ